MKNCAVSYNIVSNIILMAKKLQQTLVFRRSLTIIPKFYGILSIFLLNLRLSFGKNKLIIKKWQWFQRDQLITEKVLSPQLGICTQVGGTLQAPSTRSPNRSTRAIRAFPINGEPRFRISNLPVTRVTTPYSHMCYTGKRIVPVFPVIWALLFQTLSTDIVRVIKSNLFIHIIFIIRIFQIF